MRRRIFSLITITALTLAAGAGGMAAETAGYERHLSELVESIVLSAVPRTFEDRRHWDQHRDVFSGVKVKSDGFKLRISRRERSVRHGLWRRYALTLIDPERTLRIRFSDLEPLGGGKWTFTITADARAKVEARFEQWSLGVKLLNTSTEADASLRLRAECSLQISLDDDARQGQGQGRGRVVVFSPDVRTVHLALRNLDVRKFGELRGDAATDLFDGLEDVVEDLLQTQEGFVLKRARKEIAERRDEMRIPLGDVLTSPWATLWLLR